jgi:hypothetical protein
MSFEIRDLMIDVLPAGPRRPGQMLCGATSCAAKSTPLESPEVPKPKPEPAPEPEPGCPLTSCAKSTPTAWSAAAGDLAALRHQLRDHLQGPGQAV